LNYSYPFRIDEKGKTATQEKYNIHISELVEQLLFTIQGERVNRSSFGTNINQLLFSGNSNELASTVQLLLQGALQHWLADLIKIESIKTESRDTMINISVEYTILRNQEKIIQTIKRSI
jgi:phage baseplate assembly protein W